MVKDIENGITYVAATSVSPLSSAAGSGLSVVSITDSVPQLDTTMRGLSTSLTVETNLSITTCNQAGNAAIGIVGHSAVGGTSTFWVRNGSLAGTVLATGSTSMTSATRIITATFAVTNTQQLWWNADNSVGTADSAFIDQSPLVDQLTSYAIIGRYVWITNSSNGPDATGAGFHLPTGGFTTVYTQVAGSTSGFNFNLQTNKSVATVAGATNEGLNTTSLSDEMPYAINVTSLSGKDGCAIAFSFVGNILIVA